MKRSQFVPHLSDATSPPEFDPTSPIDAEYAWIECTLNDVIVIDEDGEWNWANNEFKWAEDNGRSVWYESFEWGRTYIDDSIGVVEKVQDLVYFNVPMLPGRYRVQGDVELTYEVSGAEYELTSDSTEDWEERIYYDDAVEVEYHPEDSHVQNFKCTKISD